MLKTGVLAIITPEGGKRVLEIFKKDLFLKILF